MHLFFCDGMYKLNLRGMQQQSFSGSSVQPVTRDGGVQTFRVCRVDSQLVCAACVREKIHQHAAVRTVFSDTVGGDSRFTVFFVHCLSRAVIRIGQQGEGDYASDRRFCIPLASYNRLIAFFNIPPLEIGL